MKKIILEGFSASTPDMKYYAFDWDDNIVHMPTEIILKNDEGEEVGMSTEDFAEYREKVGKKEFVYRGNTIVGFAENPFRNFRDEGDNQFIVDSLKAKQGPAFKDFKEAINNGSIFSIITARGHNPNVLREAVYNYIMLGYGGIDKEELTKNLKKYRSFFGEEDMSEDELIRNYLKLNKFYPVSFGDTQAALSPEIAKVQAMDEFVNYVKKLSAKLNKRAWLKNDIGNKFLPVKTKIGFSDDDPKNVEIMKKAFKDKPEVTTYSTAGGKKKKV